jgi:hypothetical protein
MMIEETDNRKTMFTKMFEKAIKIRRDNKEIDEKKKELEEEWYESLIFLKYYAETCAFLHELGKTDEEICEFLNLSSDDWEIVNEIFVESTRRPGEVGDIQSVFEDLIESRAKEEY